MTRMFKKESKALNFSEKVMLATIASSMVLVPTISTSAKEVKSQSIEATETVSISQDTSLSKSLYNATTNSEITILQNEGSLESANVEWKGIADASGYNVYYKSATNSDDSYKKLDNELIRRYPSYFRADVMGLSEGKYNIKIVPLFDGVENINSSVISDTVTVKSHTREGFGFSAESPMKTSSGGYNNDGTVPSDAEILYVTADNFNTITLDVISNKKGKKTTCTGLVDILAKRQKGYDKNHLIIRLIGEIKSSDIKGLNSSGYLQVKGCYNTTLEGVGEDATINGWGLLVRDARNIEIRNLGVMLFPDDGISLDTNNQNVWVHNNDIFYGAAGHDKDQVKGDGSCDVKGKSDYVTVSYNHFYDSGKCSLCGMSDTEEFHASYHHNWFDHSDSRHPRIRVGSIHVYNNYYDGNAKYGVGITKGGSALVEGNYFRNCKYPMLISGQGTDVYNNTKGTFSGEAGGMLKAYNNKIEGASRIVYANEDATQFDAYLATSRDEEVPNTFKSVSGGNTYNNFDTKETMYKYKLDNPEDVKDIVTTYAGRVSGGDFSWNFTAEDDTNYTLSSELMNKIKEYKSDLVSVGGNNK